MRVRCPTCRKLTTWKENPWRPFCSEICKLMDLGKWASEEYRIPVTEEGEKKTEEVRDDEGGEDMIFDNTK